MEVTNLSWSLNLVEAFGKLQRSSPLAARLSFFPRHLEQPRKFLSLNHSKRRNQWVGTFKHYDLRTSLEVAELNTRSSEDLGAKTRKIENIN